MPIKFRCEYCRQLMGIAHSKAGSLVDCPKCGREVRVPNQDGSVDPVLPAVLNPPDNNLRRAVDELGHLEKLVKEPNQFPGAPLPSGPPPSAAISRGVTHGAAETPPVFVKPVVVIPAPPSPSIPANAVELDLLPQKNAPEVPVHLQIDSIEPDLAGRTTSVNAASPKQALAGPATPPAAPEEGANVISGLPAAKNDTRKTIVLAGAISGLVGISIGFVLGLSYSRATHLSPAVAPAARNIPPQTKPPAPGDLTLSNARE